MPDERRHIEFFGPDWARGPVLSGIPEVAAVQLATAMAQLRVPLARSDSDLEDHALFIRSLADKLFPDYAGTVHVDAGDEELDQVTTQITDQSGTHSLLHCWLADERGGGETTVPPDAVVWNGGVVLDTVTTNRRWLVLTPAGGIVNVDVYYEGIKSWYWAVERNGRVTYERMFFD